MNLNQIDPKKTAILFFDILNGYYHEAGERAKERKKPMVEGAVRLMKAGRVAGIPIFFAKATIVVMAPHRLCFLRTRKLT
jgi:ureidoacrylate peracid hydrolase